jgi:putative spermidine/putrescine transport system permease protein
VGFTLARAFIGVRGAGRRAAFQALVYAPVITPGILLALGTYILQLKLNLIGNEFALALSHSMLAFPLSFAIISAALLNLDPALETAAYSLGASRRYALMHVVVPSILPAIAGAVVISFMTSWDEVVIALFQSGFSPTLPVMIFSELNSDAMFANAVAAMCSVLMLAVVLGLTTAAWLSHRQAKRRGRVA